MRLSEMQRNDVKSAVQFAKETLDETGDLRPETVRVLLRLQDDTAELTSALQELYKRRQDAGLAVPKAWKS